MTSDSDDRHRPDPGSPTSRRRWLAGSLLLGLGGLRPPTRGDDPKADDDEGDALLTAARKAGLKGVGVDRTEHYVAVGDARPAFRKQALDVCEKLAVSFDKHFRAKGFKLSLPTRRMAVVALAGRDSYAAFKGEKVDEEEGGHYDVGADRLVIFDFAGNPGDAVANASRVNTFTLVHEALHQLTFSTGLLSRKGDVPLAVSEGLATYGETWMLRDPVLGRVNRFRLNALAKADDWLPVSQLLTRDEVFRVEEWAQAAYAESWLLVYHLLDRPAMRARFRTYLDLLRDRREPARRAEDAAKALGNLAALDRELKRRANLLLQG